MKLTEILSRSALFATLALSVASSASAAGSAAGADGVDVFGDHCAVCHAVPSDSKMPSVDALMKMDANRIVSALTDGPMRLEGAKLSAEQRTAVAEFLSGGKVKETVISNTNVCKANPPVANAADQPSWAGWGLTATNTRFQQDTGGITAANVGKLKLKWAYGIANTTQMRSQPAVFGGRLYFGSQTGVVYSIDAKTGCTHWTFAADGAVRNAVSVGPLKAGGTDYAVFFSDTKANAYALDARTGKKLWQVKVDMHPASVATGSVTLHDGVLYVPITGISEESTSSQPDYECCTFRGNVSALNAATGKEIWKYYTVPKAERRGKNSKGVQLWGPAGAGIWSAPTVDDKRGLVYVATGNAYAGPKVPNSNAVIALDKKTGKQVWSKQLLAGDIWIYGCDPGSAGGDPDAGKNPNCPMPLGPDFDIAASPVLTTTPEGHDVLVIAQKSGMGWELAPENGTILWQYRVGEGAAKGAVWGAATDDRNAYFANAGQETKEPGGLYAVDLSSGHLVWFAPPDPTLCKRGLGCYEVQSAATTVIPGVVFSGSQDGGMRAYATKDGAKLWTYDTNRPFDTVNGVTANGGSIDGPGPVVAGGMVYFTSGNGTFFGHPGNVLLAFSVDGK